MKKYLLIIFSFVFISCNNHQKQNNFNHDAKLIDSVRVAVRNQLLYEQRIREDMELKRKQHGELMTHLNKRVLELEANLTIENDKLKQIKTFHWLRTQAEKERQLKEQFKVIDNISLQINAVKDSIIAFQTIE